MVQIKIYMVEPQSEFSLGLVELVNKKCKIKSKLDQILTRYAIINNYGELKLMLQCQIPPVCSQMLK